MFVKLKEKRPETPDIITFVFDLGGKPYSYTAGQFAFFELDALTADDPRGKRRHFTISASPTEEDIVQITTKLRGSGFKETLRAAAPGLEVSLEDPRGRFTLPENADEPLVFLGGGVGITPFRSMLRYATDENLPHKITLLYSASTPDQLVFRREFELLPQENHNLNIVLTVTDSSSDPEWKGEKGRIDAAKLEKYVKDIPNSIFYTCGPPPMVQAMEELCKSMSVPEDHIRIERFSGYT
jgi:ferredoxin-NADP reductase